MNNRMAAIDAAIAVGVAVLVLVISPGIAVTGMIALFVLVVCGVSLVWEARRGRRRRATRPRRTRSAKTPEL